jgi:hypothetical protein
MSRVKDHQIAQLLVEGNDDFHVVHALCKRFNVDIRNMENPNGGDFSVKDCMGIDNLIEQIPIQIKNLRKVGLIVDADTDINSRWQSIKGILNKSGYNLPESPDPNGTIIHQNGKTIGVWLMPNNDNNGMIEDFIRFLIPDQDKLLLKATKILDEIESEKNNKYNLIHKPKAFIHTWLAWQETPGSPLGKAITTKYLTTENREIVDRFIDWISKLFSVEQNVF